MKNTTRILTAVLFAATFAVSLIANGGDAYAKLKSGGSQTQNSSGGGITITVPTPAAQVFETLGITWE